MFCVDAQWPTSVFNILLYSCITGELNSYVQFGFFFEAYVYMFVFGEKIYIYLKYW